MNIMETAEYSLAGKRTTMTDFLGKELVIYIFESNLDENRYEKEGLWWSDD